jgi:hypothetical protein
LIGDRRRRACETEIENGDPAVAGDEDVLGLDVTVDDAAVVRGTEPLRDLHRDRGRLACRESTVLQPRTQGLAFQQIHGGIGGAAIGPEVVDGEDVGVREGGDGLGLALEPPQGFGVGGDALGEDLERHDPVELAVSGAVHLAHAARAERGEDLVGTEAGSGCQRHPCIGEGSIGARLHSTETLRSSLCNEPNRSTGAPEAESN